jgi:esterase FrsA
MMSFQWPVDTEDLFGERYPQMVNTGLPAQDVDAVRGAITQMWADAPGGWVSIVVGVGIVISGRW